MISQFYIIHCLSNQWKTHWIIWTTFNKECSLYLVCNEKRTFFTSEELKKLCSCQKVCDALILFRTIYLYELARNCLDKLYLFQWVQFVLPLLLWFLAPISNVYILKKTIEGYLDSIPSLTFNTIKTKLNMHALHSSRYIQSKWVLYFSHATMV